MFRLITASAPSGDCTCLHRVSLSKEPVTLKEFVNHILTRDEWGYIKVRSGMFAYPELVYKNTALLDPHGDFPDDVWDWYVVEDMTTASGGWSRMDYKIRVTCENVYK